LGDQIVSFVLTALIVVFVVYLTVTHKDIKSE